MRRTVALLAALLISLTAAGSALAAGGPTPSPKVSFSNVQQDFMCTACHEALDVARSPEAFSENTLLRELIRKGLSENQIKQQMVVQYGTAVLAKPPTHGFSLLVYIIPAAVLVAGLTVVGLTIPRWRRKTKAAAAQPLPTQPKLNDEDSERLDADLAQRL
jgi:cytochrome c-type biogenesis protein CcmH/NrfF